VLHSTFTVSGFAIDRWEEPAPGARPTQDASLVTHHGEVLRIAAIDGCSLSRPVVHPLPLDGGIWAAALTRTALVAEPDLERALDRTNAALHGAPARSPRDLPQACAVIADLGTAATRIVRAGDCEAWVRRGARWQSLFPAEIRTPESTVRFRAWVREHGDASADERYDAESTIWADPATWTTAALGRFAQVMSQSCSLVDFDELVLASDGARLDAKRLADIEGWLPRLREWERETRRPLAGAKAHDDVVLLRVRPSRAA
jgi:hypothetical protein